MARRTSIFHVAFREYFLIKNLKFPDPAQLLIDFVFLNNTLKNR